MAYMDPEPADLAAEYAHDTTRAVWAGEEGYELECGCAIGEGCRRCAPESSLGLDEFAFPVLDFPSTFETASEND
jgi:hypothetical protein